MRKPKIADLQDRISHLEPYVEAYHCLRVGSPQHTLTSGADDCDGGKRTVVVTGIERACGRSGAQGVAVNPMTIDLLILAREAGRAGESWARWTASDTVQDAAMAGDLDTDALTAAFDAGRREYRAATWRVCWTTAPADYDTCGTETLETAPAPWHGKILRRVAIEPGSYAYQTARYSSGLHPSWEEDPRIEEARVAARIEADRAERTKREAERAAGLVWLQTATDNELDDCDTYEARGVRFDDVKTERKRRETENADRARAEEWARCLAVIPEGATLVDAGEPATRGMYGLIPGRPAHVYYAVRIVRGWPDDADHATVMGEGNDNAGCVSYVADWIARGRLRVAAPGEVPPRAVVARIGHDRARDIRRAEVGGKTVWIGRLTFGETLVLDENGHLVRSKKIVAAALAQK